MDEQELERLMHQAFRPVEAPKGMAARIVSRTRKRGGYNWLAIAAALLITLSTGWYWMEQQARKTEAQAAARQFQMALNITARKLAQVNERLVVEVRLGTDTNRQENLP